jgi:hypothetical protein
LHPLDDWRADELCTNDLAYGRFATIATDDIGGAHSECVAGVEIADSGNDFTSALNAALDTAAMENANAWLRLGVRQQ